jgi:hypothetical protein
MTTLTIPVDDRHLEQLRLSAERQGLSVEDYARRVIAEAVERPVDDDFDVRQMYPHLAGTFGPAGWDDPEMDCYDALDPRKPHGSN